MKAQELRIGNFIQDSKGKVQKIYPSLLISIIEGTINFGKPILLTCEWLEKFGFKKIHSMYPVFDGSYSFEIEDVINLSQRKDGFQFFIEDEIYGCSVNVKLQHVHQLQNLYFALTGEELDSK